MYVKTAGMSAYRRWRGFGETAVTDTTGAPCPGSPGCPGYVAPGSPDYQTSLLQEILANQQSGVIQTAVAPTSTLTGWLNANGTMLAIGAAAFLGLIFVAKAGR